MDSKGATNFESDIQNTSRMAGGSSHRGRRHRWQRRLLSSRSQSSQHHDGEELDKYGECNHVEDGATYNDDLPMDPPEPARSMAHCEHQQGSEQQLLANNNSRLSAMVDNNEPTFCLEGNKGDGIRREWRFEKQRGELILVKTQDCLSSLPPIPSFATQRLETIKQGDKLAIRQLAGSESALDMRQLEVGVDNAPAGNRLPLSQVDRNDGSLSDSSHQRPESKQALFERHQMEERLRSWKESNKIVNRSSEDPFKMHIDCLERFSQNSFDNTDGYSQSEDSNLTALMISNEESKRDHPQNTNQDKHLQKS